MFCMKGWLKSTQKDRQSITDFRYSHQEEDDDDDNDNDDRTLLRARDNMAGMCGVLCRFSYTANWEIFPQL